MTSNLRVAQSCSLKIHQKKKQMLISITDHILTIGKVKNNSFSNEYLVKILGKATALLSSYCSLMTKRTPIFLAIEGSNRHNLGWALKCIP